MPVIVQKYGGSSVADVEKMGEVADKVVAAKRRGYDVVVVVSAMGKSTDELLALAKRVSHDPPRRELDMLVSTGERVSMALLSIAIHKRGCDAISFTGSQSGIITNDRHFDARIIEVRPHRIDDELSRGRIVIVAGYQGMSYKREITTLGRGGSDTTAVALAAALGAEQCEIYSDVDGVYSADPRVVPDAVHLPEIGLGVLAEMAEAGAKVLNAQAIEWARRAKITIAARRTGDKIEDDGTAAKETIAREDSLANVRAIVGQDRVAFVECPDADRLLLALGDLPIVDFAASREASVVVPLLNVPDWDKRRAALPGDATMKEGALVSVVGDGLASASSVEKFRKALGVKPLSMTAGPLRIGAVVESSALAAAQRALHEAFVRP